MLLHQFLVTFSVCIVVQKVQGRAFLYPSQAIATLLSSSSSQSVSADEQGQKQKVGSDESNIVDLRVRERSERLLQGEDKIENPATEPDNEVLPDLVQKKIAKILRKLQFLSMIGSHQDGGDGGNTDDFDVEFDSINATEGALDDVTIAQSEAKAENNYSFGLYFLELVGSIFGLAYGAAVQFQEAHRTTTAPPY